MIIFPFISFIVPGIPQQQGSKRPVGRSKDGRSIMVEANAKLKPWREVALSRALAARPAGADDGPVFAGPVAVEADFWFPRPKAHYRTGRNAHLLRDDAPLWHASAPDLDKLQRALGDVLTQAQIVLDDRLIVNWVARKQYGQPGIRVAITPARSTP